MAEDTKLILNASGQPAEGDDELAAMQSAHGALVQEHAELLTEHQALMDKCAALEASNKAMDAEHKQLIASLPKGAVKKVEPYVYSEGECQPVPKNGVCQLCGWSAAADNPKHLEPHVTI